MTQMKWYMQGYGGGGGNVDTEIKMRVDYGRRIVDEILKTSNLFYNDDVREDDPVWRTYTRMWRYTQSVLPVAYSGSFAPGAVAGFYPGNRFHQASIAVVRPESAGYHFPIPANTEVLKKEAAVLAHELAHHDHWVRNDVRWQEYTGALLRFNAVKYDGTHLSQTERLLVMEEEELAERDGRRLLANVAPELLQTFDMRASDSLRCYASLLWKGKWPDGRPAAR